MHLQARGGQRSATGTAVSKVHTVTDESLSALWVWGARVQRVKIDLFCILRTPLARNIRSKMILREQTPTYTQAEDTQRVA